MRTILFVVLATTLTAGVALAQEPAKAGNSAKGKTLVDAKGMTLYIYDRDTAAGKSSLQRQLRHQLAAADGCGRRQGLPAPGP